MAAGKIHGSFRDPSGAVYEANGRIFRGISAVKKSEVLSFLDSIFFKKNASRTIVATRVVDRKEVLDAGLSDIDADLYDLWLEHQAIEFISYPYEWSFELLKAAALFHLELHIESLSAGFDIKDASAYNIQFKGCQPIFIDTLSFCQYTEGSPWIGYKQFCEQFLAPLAINSVAGLDFNQWYRGALEGIDIESASRILPAKSYLSLTLLTNIHLHALAMSKVSAVTSSLGKNTKRKLPKSNYVHLLRSLHTYISKLEPKNLTYWKNYANNTSYSDVGTREKTDFVIEFVKKFNVTSLVDIGCNTGYYSEQAIKAGAGRVVGTDFDCGALNLAVSNARRKNLNLTPIYFDLSNPTPAIGWNLAERTPLNARLRKIDASLCLAVIHHIVIGKNVPMEDFIGWLLAMAPTGVVEFVPKSDPMVKGLLSNREDIFPNYNEETFLELLNRKCSVNEMRAISDSDRRLISFGRK